MAAVLTNGQGSSAGLLPKIHHALELVHNPYSANDSRREAQVFLEEVKSIDEAPLRGFELASDRSQSPVVRHYALSLLEHAIKHKWGDYTEVHADALRSWVLALCRAVSGSDPAYLRAKTAQLWVEVAKRSWAAEWPDMDEHLVQLWQIPDSPAHKELTLTILETLAEEVFSGDDSVVAMRESTLSKACVEVFTPASDLAAALPTRQPLPSLVRSGEEGWISRVAGLLAQCLSSGLDTDRETRSVAIKGLSLLGSVMSWIIPRSVVSTGCVRVLSAALASSQVAIQKTALDGLHVLYSRANLSDREFAGLVCPMFQTEMVNLFGRLVKWSTVGADDIDDDKYQFAKKFSEMLSCLGSHLDRRMAALLSSGADIEGFLGVTLEVLQSDSLIVSIPVLVSWHRLLSGSLAGSAAGRGPFIGPLLETCSRRLIRYENLPEDSRDPTVLFLMEDTDTIPERHAFLGNYRRYSIGIIQSIAQLEVSGALNHILIKADDVLATLCNGQCMPDKPNYLKHSLPVLRVDAQLSVVEAAFRGYMKWRKDGAHQQAEQRAAIEHNLEAWCNKLLGRVYQDPQIRKRILQLLVFFSTTALDKNAAFMLMVLEHILMTWPALEPEYRDYNESIKELQAESTVELQRLATEMPDHLLAVYDQLEARVSEMIGSGTLDEKRSVAYKSFLFLIIHRAQGLDPVTKTQKLQGFVAPTLATWQQEDIKRSLGSFEGFSALLGLDKAQRYLSSRNAHQIPNWGTHELDAEGLELQADLEKRNKLLPLRATKSLLMNSVEKLDRSSATFQVSQALWESDLPIILSQLLQFLSHAHASHNPNNWTGIAPEVRHSVVGRVLCDRFWQAGISDGSKDDFYARVMEKRATMEGLASSIRGSVRFVRETSYALLCCISRFDVLFYGFSELPGPLSEALFANSAFLSAHQQINLLHLVKYLTDDVPPELREGFLPPILGGCFRQMDAKIQTEWDRLDQQQGVEAGADALEEEMKSESILRQASHTAVLMVAEFLDPNRKNQQPLANRRGQLPPELANAGRVYPPLRRFSLLQSSIVEPLMLFSTHAIRIKDQRACSIILRVFRSIVPEFVPPSTKEASGRGAAAESSGDGGSGGGGGGSGDGGGAGHSQSKPDETWPIPAETATAIREYISSEVLRACITSFHEPYYVELQKDLAMLIAQILVYYGPTTDTGRQLLASLPNVREQDVNRLAEFVEKPGSNTRQQRAVVLDILKDLKGVSISEMGRLPKSHSLGGTANRARKSDRSKMAQQFMTDQSGHTYGGQTAGGGGGASDGLEGLEGIASLFDGQ